MATRRGKGSTPEQPSTWPLGDYLREQRGVMSVREAARRADISESRWRQVELGVQRMAGGVEVPVHPRPETVAAMARAIGGDVSKGLELAGHKPELHQWLLEDEHTISGPDADWFRKLPRAEREQVLAELQRLHVDAEVEQAQGSSKRRSG